MLASEAHQFLTKILCVCVRVEKLSP